MIFICYTKFLKIYYFVLENVLGSSMYYYNNPFPISAETDIMHFPLFIYIYRYIAPIFYTGLISIVTYFEFNDIILTYFYLVKYETIMYTEFFLLILHGAR